MKPRQVKPAVCACGQQLNAMMGPPPEPLTVCICIGCGRCLVFSVDLRPRPATAEEVAELEPAVKRELARARQIIIAARRAGVIP